MKQNTCIIFATKIYFLYIYFGKYQTSHRGMYEVERNFHHHASASWREMGIHPRPLVVGKKAKEWKPSPEVQRIYQSVFLWKKVLQIRSRQVNHSGCLNSEMGAAAAASILYVSL